MASSGQANKLAGFNRICTSGFPGLFTSDAFIHQDFDLNPAILGAPG